MDAEVGKDAVFGVTALDALNNCGCCCSAAAATAARTSSVEPVRATSPDPSGFFTRADCGVVKRLLPAVADEAEEEQRLREEDDDDDEEEVDEELRLLLLLLLLLLRVPL